MHIPCTDPDLIAMAEHHSSGADLPVIDAYITIILETVNMIRTFTEKKVSRT
jgi:hypothetical protein